MDDAQLRTIWQQRQVNDRVAPLSQPLSWFMKHTLAKRARQLGQLAKIWDDLIPETIRDHTALEKFQGGVLTVLVDSPAHRFQLQTLLMGGLLRELQSRFPGALNKVRVVPGRFYSVDLAGSRRYEF
jgi:hypothetical protein